MMQAQEPGKRIVSKAEHARHAAIKYSFTLLGMATCTYGFYCEANLIRLWMSRPSGIPAAAGIIILSVVGLLFAGNIWISFATVKAARTTDAGIPLTRANTADLPANDSLVRASQKPAQAQKVILLRAVAQTQDGQEEQLLRAAVGKQE